MNQKFQVTGMTCSACSSRVEKVTSQLSGVESASVNLLTNSMQVTYDPEVVSASDIISAVEKSGYGANPVSGTSGANAANEKNGSSRSPAGLAAADPMSAQLVSMKQRLWISFGFLIPLMYVSMGHMMGAPLPVFLTGHPGAVNFALTQFLLCLPILYVNRAYFFVGFKTLFHGAPNMDSLIAIGSGSALVYGIFAIYRMAYGMGVHDMDLVSRYHMDLYFESAATILALITLGKFLETKSKGKTSEAISRLMDLAPETALVLRNGVETEVPVEEVQVGDTFFVKPGTRVPVDGFITEGTSSLDESALTGESIPVEKQKGDSVTSASINGSGFLTCEATKVGSDTTLSQIIALVEEASASKAPIAKLADKIAGVFVPTVIIIAAVSAVVWLFFGATAEFALSIGISVLVISCPCALGLATPVAIMVGTGKGAENGILIKSGEALEIAHSIDTVVLDKTGTVTEGKPQVTDILLFDQGMDETQLLTLAASLEKGSEHPLAAAIMRAARERSLTPRPVERFEAIFGRGLAAEVSGTTYFAGNLALLNEKQIDASSGESAAEKLASQGKTPLFFADQKSLLGIIAVADVVKAGSKQAIEGFQSLGINVIMLTGDNRRTAEAIKEQIGIPQVIAEVLPQDKERHVAQLRQEGHVVAMVGDGINDAPALAQADVGIAIGAGTDVAIESADIVLMKSDLLDAVTAIRLSKAVIRNIKQNLFWAFFYNSVGIPLAAGILYIPFSLKLNPMFAAFAMSFSSVFVVTNALRLKLFRAEHSGVQATGLSEADKTELIEKERKGEETMMIKMYIEGMSCSHCSGRVEAALNAFEGVKADVNLEGKYAAITKPDSVDSDDLKDAVEKEGYCVNLIEDL